MANNGSPTLADIIQGVLDRQAEPGKSGCSQTIYNLKDASKMLNFLTSNHITDLAGMDNKFSTMIDKQIVIRNKLKPIDRRLKTLDEHIKQAEYCLEFKAVNKKYKQIKPKYQDDYRESHRREITLYEAAENYLKGAVNGKIGIPLKSWKAEKTKLTTERSNINQEYAT